MPGQRGVRERRHTPHERIARPWRRRGRSRAPRTSARRPINVAIITGVPSDVITGMPLPGIPNVGDLALAVVDVIRPGIDIVKTTSTPVVLTTGLTGTGQPIEGPDTPYPDPRPGPDRLSTATTSPTPVPPPLPLDLDDPAAAQPFDSECAPVVFSGRRRRRRRPPRGRRDVGLHVRRTTQPHRRLQHPTDDRERIRPRHERRGGHRRPRRRSSAPPDDPLAVSASDTAQVLVIEPRLTSTKTASATIALAGDDVTLHVRRRQHRRRRAADRRARATICASTSTRPCRRRPTTPSTSATSTATASSTARTPSSPEQWTFTCVQRSCCPEPPATSVVNTATVLGIDPLGNVYERRRHRDGARVRSGDQAHEDRQRVARTRRHDRHLRLRRHQRR